MGPRLTKVWTSRRKWLGNLVPMVFWLIPTAAGVYLTFKSGKIIGLGLYVLIAGQVIGWLALNFFGLFENGRIKRDSMRNLTLRRPPAPGPVIFVGAASSKNHSLLDAHEDVGFLSFGAEELEFIGDEKRVCILREQINKVHYRPNVHSSVGLGRWIAIEATINGLPVRLQIEPRERNTLLGNFALSAWLKKVIEDWRAGIMPEPAPHTRMVPPAAEDESLEPPAESPPDPNDRTDEC